LASLTVWLADEPGWAKAVVAARGSLYEPRSLAQAAR
jgi:hypothetical protein